MESKHNSTLDATLKCGMDASFKTKPGLGIFESAPIGDGEAATVVEAKIPAAVEEEAVTEAPEVEVELSTDAEVLGEVAAEGPMEVDEPEVTGNEEPVPHAILGPHRCPATLSQTHSAVVGHQRANQKPPYTQSLTLVLGC